MISAAFIGPGTVTTAAKAGATYGTSLIWALLFSIIATYLLQEAAARIPLLSGKNLGQALQQVFQGQRGKWLNRSLAVAVILGCAAYEAGNILGAVAGLELVFPDSFWPSILILGSLAFGLLWIGKIQGIAQALGIVVALMGLLFLVVALNSPLGEELATLRPWPQLPQGSELLIIALIGTTIVPYNLFLGSGLKHGQSMSEMRNGLGGAILLGGLISMVILLVGTQVEGAFSFEALAQSLSNKAGIGGKYLFGFGLAAAGFTSGVTAPLAAAVAASSLLGQNNSTWQSQGKAFRGVWLAVLLFGLAFGLMQVQPIPVIILAQAVNGLLLPMVATLLYILINDGNLIPGQGQNRWGRNILTLSVIGVSIYLGGLNLLKAIARMGNLGDEFWQAGLWPLAILAGLLSIGLGIRVARK